MVSNYIYFFFINGCTKEQVYQNMYEGMSKSEQEQIVNESNDPIPLQSQSYREYTIERDEAVKKDGKKM